MLAFSCIPLQRSCSQHTWTHSPCDSALNLHNVSLEQDASLDFFTLLSSVFGLCGNKGQANYAAANAFLDAFASSRRSLGLSACSVDLGVIADVGYMAERDYLKSRYDDAVWHVIDERLLRKIFGFSILQQQQPAPVNIQSASQMITGLRVPQPEHSELLRDARFAGLSSQGHIGGQEQAGNRGDPRHDTLQGRE